MLRRYRLSVLLAILTLTLSACADPDPARRGPTDAGADVDAGADADADADPLTCENIGDRFNTLVAENTHCETDNDCSSRQLTPWGYCECNPMIGDYNTVAFHSRVSAQVDTHIDFFLDNDCYDRPDFYNFVCDDGPITETYCNDEGRCAARTDETCLSHL
ncbi:hypothetical protein FRC96_17115 [Lujinxingia vulgaris]|uniref:Lipoprotein n=1 Tax=Lujinxingia vulgaris TaxID=2600176 RepID=A0A5C6WVG0_9DELT|nr:hypothetical protein [Lujinxingia vulgaris]TXD32559.1 hypothetical protein FRC96_17115 [Lujinxingia vulgaris]